ncbi:pogo transposable element with ZNF domain [Scomber scombrus]|uniref:Pogo transposable element with ZNF domain n=1 Tax=Scomber scombrus TaxID=13677 RepID=A0AAV1QF80_SCOSC
MDVFMCFINIIKQLLLQSDIPPPRSDCSSTRKDPDRSTTAVNNVPGPDKVMEETVGSDDGGADLLMECDEDEEFEVEQHDEALPAVPIIIMEDEEDEEEGEQVEVEMGEANPPVRVIPIPLLPLNPFSHFSMPMSGVRRVFMVNGQMIPLWPGGGSTELKLLSHPSGSASGFTIVQIPDDALRAPPPPPEPEHIPIITGVVSGEAAQKVLNEHNVNFIPQNPRQKSPDPPPSQKQAARGRGRPAVPKKKPQRKGQPGQDFPPDCMVCLSPFKLITELRGLMCLCSPAIAQSLRILRRKKPRRWIKHKKKINKSHTRTQPGYKSTSPLQKRRSDDFLSEQISSPPPLSLKPDPSDPPPEPPPHGKLVIMVEDFYYGTDPGPKTSKVQQPARKYTGPYRCIHCTQTLPNNIQLMSHMQQHVSSMSQQDEHMDSVSSCPHCYRHFSSAFKLQCHLEAVHSQYESTAKCKICELEFGSEPTFLWHMKSTHKPGEMPYICQVCDFRSSFYSDVWSHFLQTHADTNNLMCQYCLRVLRSSSCYQQHFARHQRKTVFSCDMCRLHFLYVKERVEHKTLHHTTHIKPTQLTGLKPGTKVTVRTYSVVGGSENDSQRRSAAPCKVVDVEPGPPPPEPPKRRPVERLGPLLSQLTQDSEALGVSRPSRCVECLTSVQDFSSHFPSLVHCSLCRFTTCCSTSYANHMINNHAGYRKKPQYFSMFQSDCRYLSERLRCESCSFSSCRGDVMANHLAERPEHCCVIGTHTHTEQIKENIQTDSVTSSGGRGGAFIPIHLLPSTQTPPQLSVKTLHPPSSLSSSPAMTVKFLGRRPPEQSSGLSVSQLSVLLFSLCHGLPQAARRFHLSPLTLLQLTEQRDRRLARLVWHWKTDRMAAWVLSQREQQLLLQEETLLETAQRALGDDSQLIERYGWAVDFMLRHHLSLQPISSRQRRGLPRDIHVHSMATIRSLCAKVDGSALPPRSVGFMDELAVFINTEKFSNQNPAALKLFGSPGDSPLLDVVLSGLSDGTFLPPLLFFRGAAVDVPDGFPENVLLEARLEGFSDQERLHIWTQKVWRPHLASLPDSRSVLMVDVHRGHLTDEFHDDMRAASTELVFIPAGCCCRLQPLDLCITPVLREFLQAQWTQLVSQGGLDGLSLDQLALTLTCWFSEVSFMLNADRHILHRSFTSVCNLQQEQQEEKASMIRTLTEMLIQPPASHLPLPPPHPPPAEQVELLLVMQQEEEEEEEERKWKQPSLRSPSSVCRVFDADSDQDSFLGFDDAEMDD